MGPSSPAADLLASLGLADCYDRIYEATGASLVTDLADFELCSDAILVTEVGLNQHEVRAIRKATTLVMKASHSGSGSGGSGSDPTSMKEKDMAAEKARPGMSRTAMTIDGGAAAGAAAVQMPKRLPTRLAEQQERRGQASSSTPIEVHSIDGAAEEKSVDGQQEGESQSNPLASGNYSIC
jgi:hypothetical protein